MSNWSPGYVTKTKSAAIIYSSFWLSRFSPGYFRFCSGESLSLAPTRACPPTDRLDDATTAFPPLCVFSSSVGRPPSPFQNFKPHSSHTGPPTASKIPTLAAVSQIPLSRLLSVGFQPSLVTGLQHQNEVHRT